MSKVQMLNALVKQRLTAAVEEIFGLFERTIAEYEEELCRSKEENERQRKLLDAVFNPQLRLHRTDVQQLSVSKEEIPPEQWEWSPSLDQQHPEPPHIKEEQQELWVSQEREQLHGLEEADSTKFPFTPVPVKSEDDEEKPQPSLLHQRQTEQMETEADGENCGGPEPAKNSDPDIDLHINTEDQTGDSSEPETDDSCEWNKTREAQSGLNSSENNDDDDDDFVSDSSCSADEKTLSCSDCGKRFDCKAWLKQHMRTHTGEKPFSCSVCKKSFAKTGNLQAHMRTHTGEKRLSCSVCQKRFSHNTHLKNHMRCHTGEKPFSCSVCKISFARNDSLQKHMRIHTGDKPFPCSVCKKSFAQRYTLKVHMRIHTGEKPFSCSVCKKHFAHKTNIHVHMKTHTGEKALEDCGGPEPDRHLEPDTDDKTGDSSDPESYDSDYCL